MKTRLICAFAIVALVVAANRAQTTAAEDAKPATMKIAEGAMTLAVDSDWQAKQPRVRIIEREYEIPAVEGDAQAGRLTVMAAGGSVDANIERWQGQFTQPDGGSTKEKTRLDKQTIAGQVVHTVDISGTYKDQRGPFAPATMREDYRMLAAIVLTKEHGNYFIKMYGPAKTMAANADAFQAMVKSLKVNAAEKE